MSHKQKGWIITILIIVVTLLTVWGSLSHAEAKESNWNFYFFGVNAKDFEDRKVLPIIVGVVSSYAAHELGHIISAELMGCDASFDWSERVAYAGDGYDDLSDDQKALFHGAGFLAQILVGGALTAIPSTRYSDFNVGFNSFSMVTGLVYGITRGVNGSADENSDVNNLDEYGYNGRAIAFGTALIAGGLTYISLDKYKADRLPDYVDESGDSFSLMYNRTMKGVNNGYGSLSHL